MTDQNNSWVYFNTTCFKGSFIKYVNLPKRCPSSNKVSFFWMMFNSINLTIMLDFMLHNYQILHVFVILFDTFISFDGFQIEKDFTLSVQFFNELLIRQIHFSHYQVILFLVFVITRVGTVSDVTKSFLIVAF